MYRFSYSVVSDSLQAHEPQDARPACPSPTPRVHPNSCPSSRWCHPTISSSVIPFSSCPQPFPASGSFPMSQLFVSGGQSIGVSASTSVLPMNTQDWSSLGWTGWITLLSTIINNNKANILMNREHEKNDRMQTNTLFFLFISVATITILFYSQFLNNYFYTLLTCT